LPGLPHKAAIRPLLPDSLIPPKNTLIPVGKFAVLAEQSRIWQRRLGTKFSALSVNVPVFALKNRKIADTPRNWRAGRVKALLSET
jgi:hypothetical protein